MVVYLRRGAARSRSCRRCSHTAHHLHPAVHRVQDAVSASGPRTRWDMASLAAVAHVTERHLLRLFGEHAGVSPLQYLENDPPRACPPVAAARARA